MLKLLSYLTITGALFCSCKVDGIGECVHTLAYKNVRACVQGSPRCMLPCGELCLLVH